MTRDARTALADYNYANQKIADLRSEVNSLNTQILSMEEAAEEAWVIIRDAGLVRCSCGGSWPCSDSTLPGYDTYFHRHIIDSSLLEKTEASSG